MNKNTIVLIFVILCARGVEAQKNVRSFIFGHSLIHHEVQKFPTPSQETSVPHWFHFLAEEAGHDYAVSGQYGFLPQHANLPPNAQWGFDHVEGAWDSDNEPFEDAGFTNILITPGNFIQWQAPTENYPNQNVSPISATNEIFDWCIEKDGELEFYIYENWPDMGGYLANGFPPTSTEWDNYNNYLQGDFHDWFLGYHDLLRERFPNACVRMIPVGPIISDLLYESPFDEIEITDLYEDDAPHGRASIYFLASLATYMTMYEEKAPESYNVESIIHPIIANNYSEVVNFIWNKLNQFNADSHNGDGRVFCSPLITNAHNQIDNQISVDVFPNPVLSSVEISGIQEAHLVEIYSLIDQARSSSILISNERSEINLDHLISGSYVLVGRSSDGEVLYRKRIIKF